MRLFDSHGISVGRRGGGGGTISTSVVPHRGDVKANIKSVKNRSGKWFVRVRAGERSSLGQDVLNTNKQNSNSDGPSRFCVV